VQGRRGGEGGEGARVSEQEAYAERKRCGYWVRCPLLQPYVEDHGDARVRVVHDEQVVTHAHGIRVARGKQVDGAPVSRDCT